MYEHHTLNTSATVHTYFSYIIHIHKTHTYITKTKKKNTKTKKNWYDSEKAKKKHLHHRTIQQVVHFFL